ncbi:hypothetical protein DFQ27_009793 [Actinomortierella ambigua]|uniref:NADP-dependent oxidoreductase domain-containing protein n=1 Tax=Actinomortierella ambigua TaxID=1343610 RepID=A0A9P6UAD7_9FUNG|nr:hypothetical protein DFQ27_009793 [Actinomortierella ambigua]
MSTIRAVTLRNGVKMPLVGLGTYRVRDQALVDTCVLEGLRAGYRLIDTATVYRNEHMIGNALKRIFAENLIPGLKREDIFITSKLAPIDQGYDACYKAVMKSINALQVDYIDCYLIHWPGTQRVKPSSPQNAVNRAESWRALEDHYHAKRLRAIGVSNYTTTHLLAMERRAQGEGGTSTSTSNAVLPHVHQFEMHPRLLQNDLMALCQRLGIQVQAYSSLGEGRLVIPAAALQEHVHKLGQNNNPDGRGALPIMGDLIRKYFPTDVSSSAAAGAAGAAAGAMGVGEITAAEYGKRAAQILLRWGIQHGAVVIPKSTNRQRIWDNFDLFGFELDPQDMAALDAYSEGEERTRYCWDPTLIQ